MAKCLTILGVGVQSKNNAKIHKYFRTSDTELSEKALESHVIYKINNGFLASSGAALYINLL